MKIFYLEDVEGDYGAKSWLDEYKVHEEYSTMVKENLENRLYYIDDCHVVARIMHFTKVDSNFIKFIVDKFMDEATMERQDFWVMEE